MYAFCSSISMLLVVFEFFFSKTVFSLKFSKTLPVLIDPFNFSINQNFLKYVLESLCMFRSIETDFRSIQIFKIVLSSLCSFRSIEAIFQSIETRESGFFKKLKLDCFKPTFSNFPLSLRLGKAPLRIFCRFRPNFLQGFSLLRPVRPLYPSFWIYFHVFMHKLMHFSRIFKTFQNWDFCWINLFF